MMVHGSHHLPLASLLPSQTSFGQYCLREDAHSWEIPFWITIWDLTLKIHQYIYFTLYTMFLWLICTEFSKVYISNKEQDYL